MSTTASDDAYELEDRARALLDAGDLDGAIELAREALALDAGRSGACEIAVDAWLKQGRPDDAVALLQDVVEAQPDQIWPYALIAEVAAATRPEDADAAELALQVASLPAAADAADAVRKLLRRAELWPALTRHVEHQIGQTLHIRTQIALHEELADLHGTRLQDQETSRLVRSRAEIWRNVPELIATYWQGLETHAHDPSAWDEAEAFFRQNGLAEDLARLLEHSLLGAGPDETVDRFDDLLETYRKIPDADWAHLAGLIEQAAAAAPEPFGGRLRERLAAAKAEAARQKKREAGEPTQALSTNLPPWLLFLAAASIGITAAVVLILKYWI